MTIFNQQRIPSDRFKLDVERMRQGWYSDKYFDNVEMMMHMLTEQNYQHQQHTVGDAEVEMQFFTRRQPSAIVVGVDKALAMLRHCTGYFDGTAWTPTWDSLEVEAVHDGSRVSYGGNPRLVQPALRVRGRYRDFANLETPIIGILSRASRIATNVYEVLEAAGGKPVLFFPARFDLHEVQAADGYAYDIARQCFNHDYGHDLQPFISTNAQGDWWGGTGGGTVPHAIIACFMGDTVAAMRAFAQTQPIHIPRIALVDFHNDVSRTAAEVATNFWQEYVAALRAGNEPDADKWILHGIRLDTAANLIDHGLTPLGDPKLDMGVTPRLVTLVRQTLNNLWTHWELDAAMEPIAQAYCQQIKIVVSGGFTKERITLFEQLQTPVDMYAVGSAMMLNHAATNTDFTADVVRVRHHGEWVALAKVGRQVNQNPMLERVNLNNL